MARSNENILLKKISGHIGRQLVIKQYGNTTVIAKYPQFPKKRKFSPRQLQAQKLMRSANAYAKGTMLDEQASMEAQVRLNVTRNKLYTVLVKEYFKQAKEGGKKNRQV